jgi:hypothetical protein
MPSGTRPSISERRSALWEDTKHALFTPFEFLVRAVMKIGGLVLAGAIVYYGYDFFLKKPIGKLWDSAADKVKEWDRPSQPPAPEPKNTTATKKMKSTLDLSKMLTGGRPSLEARRPSASATQKGSGKGEGKLNTKKPAAASKRGANSTDTAPTPPVPPPPAAAPQNSQQQQNQLQAQPKQPQPVEPKSALDVWSVNMDSITKNYCVVRNDANGVVLELEGNKRNHAKLVQLNGSVYEYDVKSQKLPKKPPTNLSAENQIFIATQNLASAGQVACDEAFTGKLNAAKAMADQINSSKSIIIQPPSYGYNGGYNMLPWGNYGRGGYSGWRPRFSGSFGFQGQRPMWSTGRGGGRGRGGHSGPVPGGGGHR